MDPFLDFIEWLAFEAFRPHILAVIALILAFVYLYKWTNYGRIMPRSRQGYLAKGFNWLVFCLAFFVFPCLPLVEGRALLRLAVAFLMLSELAYQYPLIMQFAREVKQWIRR
jgi:hypothetical protein